MSTEEYTIKENARAVLEGQLRAFIEIVENVGLIDSEISEEIKDATLDATDGRLNMDLA